jgi:hypothetical protein
VEHYIAQTLAKAIGSQGTKPKLSGYTYDSNAQAQNVVQALLCVFCGTPGVTTRLVVICLMNDESGIDRQKYFEMEETRGYGFEEGERF